MRIKDGGVDMLCKDTLANDITTVYDLQSRWRLEGNYLRYFGLRMPPNMLKNTVRLRSGQARIIEKLPAPLTSEELVALGGLLGTQVVPAHSKRKIPDSPEEATFCKCCAANDVIIPGIEFGEDGRCPICSTYEETRGLRSLLPIMNEIPRSRHSRFDVAVFYTGGKDSTYLLYYLSRILGLRVLALTWEIPYMSDSAKKSIENAKTRLPSVEFIIRRVADNDLKKIYRKLYALSGNTCACPSLAYALFYPELVSNRVPYFVAGNEPAQVLGLYYNRMAPRLAYSFAENRPLNFLLNVGRVLTLHPPLKKGQLHTLTTMRQLAYGDSKIKTLAGYSNPLIGNVCLAIREVPSITKPLKRAIRASSVSGNIPAFVQVDLDEICGGTYHWKNVKDEIIRECGWVAPEGEKGLHTSCKIEKCKEHTQFMRFRNMESDMIPFSALEMAIASRNKNISREDALTEIRTSLGFCLEEVPECAVMKEYFEK